MLYVDVEKKYGKFNLKSGFEMQENEKVIGLLGASGSGKSLTLKIIAGIEKADCGKITLDDETLFDFEKNINIKPRYRNIGYLFQNHALFPNMSVLENVITGIRDKNLSKNDKKLLATKSLKELEIEHIKEKYPPYISGGESQRVALARLIVNAPKVVLLDEPFSALDEHLKFKIELELFDLLKSHNIKSIFVSHNKDEIYRNCDSVCIISNGYMEEKTKTKELLEAPKTYASFLISGGKNISEIEKIDENTIFAKKWGIKIHTDCKVEDFHKYIGIKSGDIIIFETKTKDSFEIKIKKVIEELSKTSIIAYIDTKEKRDIHIETDCNTKVDLNKKYYVHFQKNMLLK